MKEHLRSLVLQAVEALENPLLTEFVQQKILQIERTKDARFGDFSCNIAMLVAKVAKMKPRDLAEKIVEALPESNLINRAAVAGPGFINFYLTADAIQSVVTTILAEGNGYGHTQIGAGRKVNLEFVSSNPTGPLHVGHGRGAAYGATLGNILTAAGYRVHREYYVNDAGRQMHILAASLWLRYLALLGETVSFPVAGYRGDYLPIYAEQLRAQVGEKLRRSAKVVFADLPIDGGEQGSSDKDSYIDALIARMKTLLKEEEYQCVFQLALTCNLSDIKADLAEFGVNFDEWFHESSLVDSGAMKTAIEHLQAQGCTFEKEGALWFRASDFGDDKDRVLLRSNGQHTYFAADIAYHLNKFERGYDLVVDVLGSDHHGYVPRIIASLKAAAIDPARFKVMLIQFAILYRGEEKVQMSTRGGEYVTLRTLRDEVGVDAARFFYVMRKHEQHVDFDLELAKSESADNPVYYVQYAHARVCSVLAQAEEKGMAWDKDQGLLNLSTLSEGHEKALLAQLARFPEVLESAAINFEPHVLAQFLKDCANDFHAYYNAYHFLVDDSALRNARLGLCAATRQVLKNGLELIGVSAPERM